MKSLVRVTLHPVAPAPGVRERAVPRRHLPRGVAVTPMQRQAQVQGVWIRTLAGAHGQADMLRKGKSVMCYMITTIIGKFISIFL